MTQEELFKQLNKFDNYTKKINFLNENLKRLSYGSARIVYSLDELRVLKLAKNKKGIIQNKVEFDMYNKNPDILAKISEKDDQYNWVIMEKALLINELEFENFSGLNFEIYCDYLNYVSRKIDPRKYMNIGNVIDESVLLLMINHDFVDKLITFVKFCDIDIKDLYKINSYGLVERENIKKIVLIDYGITNEVYFKYYRIYEKRLLK